MRQGLLQALGVAVYIILVGTFIFNANHILPVQNNFLAPITFLTLFSTSVLICALIVFYKPYKLFISGKKKEALDAVIYTTVYLFAILIIFLGILFFLR